MKLVKLWLPAELLEAIYTIGIRDRYRSRNTFINCMLRQSIFQRNRSRVPHTSATDEFASRLKLIQLPVTNVILDKIDAIVIEDSYPDRSALFADILSQSIKDLGYTREGSESR